MSIDTASMDAPPSGTSSNKACRVAVSLPGLPHTMGPLSWSDTNVRYRWCMRQEISSTPTSTSPDRPIGVEHVEDHSFADRAHGAPGHPGEGAHGGLVGLGHQPRHQILEVAGMPGIRARERHALGQHTVPRAAQPPAPQENPTYPPAHVQM